MKTIKTIWSNRHWLILVSSTLIWLVMVNGLLAGCGTPDEQAPAWVEDALAPAGKADGRQSALRPWDEHRWLVAGDEARCSDAGALEVHDPLEVLKADYTTEPPPEGAWAEMAVYRIDVAEGQIISLQSRGRVLLATMRVSDRQFAQGEGSMTISQAGSYVVLVWPKIGPCVEADINGRTQIVVGPRQGLCHHGTASVDYEVSARPQTSPYSS